MKKNLTLLMMLMAFVGIVTAQSPKFNYSAVVRHHVNQYVTVDGDTLTDIDTLYYNKGVTINISVKRGATVNYKESHSATTDENGFVTIVIGEGSPITGSLADLAEIDWNDSIVAEFVLEDTTLYSRFAMKPVPYALQTGNVTLTTPLIAYYMQHTLTVDDARNILHDFIDNNTGVNGGLQEDVENLIEDSLKTRRAMDSLMVVAKAYLAQVDVDYLQQVYNTLNTRTAFKSRTKELLKAYVSNPANTLPVLRNSVNDLLSWYLDEHELMTDIKADVERIYQAAQDISAAEKPAIKDTVKGYLSQFAKSTAFVNIVTSYSASIASVLTTVIGNITANDADAAFGWFEMKNSDVKNEMRDRILVPYIQAYTTDYNGTATADKTHNLLYNAVTAAVNNEKGHLVKKCVE